MFTRIILIGGMILGSVMVELQADHSNSKRNSLADRPDSVKMEITDLPSNTQNNDKAFTKTFKEGRKVRFQLTATNTSDNMVTLFKIDPFYQNRPRLFKDGQLIPYRENVTKLLESKDKEPTPERILVIRLNPGQVETFGMLDLDDWYAPLTPGIYELTNRNRLVYGGGWTSESPTITFAVEASKN